MHWKYFLCFEALFFCILSFSIQFINFQNDAASQMVTSIPVITCNIYIVLLGSHWIVSPLHTNHTSFPIIVEDLSIVHVLMTQFLEFKISWPWSCDVSGDEFRDNLLIWCESGLPCLSTSYSVHYTSNTLAEINTSSSPIPPTEVHPYRHT